jgi:hypothetical protein
LAYFLQDYWQDEIIERVLRPGPRHRRQIEEEESIVKLATKSLIGAGLAFVAASSALAVPISISDNYVGADAHGWGDRIGNSSYEVRSMDVSFDATFMNVRIFTNFNQATDPYGTLFGDLFISTNSWHPYGAAPYTQDDASNGEHWEFVFDTSQNQLYGGAFTILLSDNAPPEVSDPSRYVVRNGQEVLRNNGGVAFAGSSVDLGHAGNNGYIDYHILIASLNLSNNAELGLKWAMSCANDVIAGQVAYSRVPEPGTLALLGLGLLGLGLTQRRKAS